jgi:hypothetical protein
MLRTMADAICTSICTLFSKIIWLTVNLNSDPHFHAATYMHMDMVCTNGNRKIKPFHPKNVYVYDFVFILSIHDVCIPVTCIVIPAFTSSFGIRMVINLLRDISEEKCIACKTTIGPIFQYSTLLCSNFRCLTYLHYNVCNIQQR